MTRAELLAYALVLASLIAAAVAVVKHADAIDGPKPMPTMPIPTIPEQARCPQWEPGLSQMTIVFLGADGEIEGCVRVRERSMVLPRVTF